MPTVAEAWSDAHAESEIGDKFSDSELARLTYALERLGNANDTTASAGAGPATALTALEENRLAVSAISLSEVADVSLAKGGFLIAVPLTSLTTARISPALRPAWDSFENCPERTVMVRAGGFIAPNSGKHYPFSITNFFGGYTPISNRAGVLSDAYPGTGINLEQDELKYREESRPVKKYSNATYLFLYLFAIAFVIALMSAMIFRIYENAVIANISVMALLLSTVFVIAIREAGKKDEQHDKKGH